MRREKTTGSRRSWSESSRARLFRLQKEGSQKANRRGRRLSDHVHLEKASPAPDVLEGGGRVAGAASAGIDDPGGHGARPHGGGAQDPARVHLYPARRDDGQVDARSRRDEVRLSRNPAAARAVSRSCLRRQQPGARPRRTLDRRGHGRGGKPRAGGCGFLERGASGQEERSPRRSDHRPDGRSPCRTGHPSAVGRDVHGTPELELRGCGLHLRVSEYAVVEIGRRCRCRWRTTRKSFSSACLATAAPKPSAANGEVRPRVCWIRSVSRCRLSRRSCRRATASGCATTWTKCARSSAASSRWMPPCHAVSICPRLRSAFRPLSRRIST